MGDIRETIAGILDLAGDATSKLSSAVPPEARAAVIVGAGIAKLAASLVRSLGVAKAHAVLEELKRRVDSGAGVISDADLAKDDAKIDGLLDELFGARPQTAQSPGTTIVVDGREHEVAVAVLSYAHAVQLAGLTGKPSVMARLPGGWSRVLTPNGSPVRVEAGLIVNVSHTNSA